MKKFIRNSLLFIPLMIIAYLILIIAWGSFAPAFLKKNLDYPLGSFGHFYSRIAEAKTTRDVDILFLGSSHAYRGFDPRLFKEHGYTSFNLGSSSQTPLQTKILLDRYLDRINPKLIVYEVYPATFTMDGVEASLDLIANDTIDSSIFKMALRLNNIKTYNTLIYGYYRQLSGMNKNFKEHPDKDDDSYVAGGFVEKKLSYYKVLNVNDEGKNEWVPNKEQIVEFEKIVALINQKGIKLILVQAPVTKPVFNNYTNNLEIDTYFSGQSEYYNFNIILNIVDSLHFYNRDHLNQAGVKLFNEAVLKKIFKK